MEHFGRPDAVRVSLITDALAEKRANPSTLWSTLTRDHGPLTGDDLILIASAANQEPLGAALLRPCGGTCANLLLPNEQQPSLPVIGALAKRAAQVAGDQGLQLIQCVPPDLQPHTPLERAGFRKLTTMLTLVWSATDSHSCRVTAIQLERCLPDDESEFIRTLAMTFESSCDFPELNRFQTAQDVVSQLPPAGHFWIHRRGDNIGTLLLRGEPTAESLELAYIGILPERRRRGWGTCAVQETLNWARDRNPSTRIVAGVDVRNEPAIRLYTRLGFVEVSARSVYCLELSPNA